MSPPDQPSEASQASLLSTTLAHTTLEGPHPLYHWTPLSDPSKQIRVLKIVPTDGTRQIRCSLEVRRLVEDPPHLQPYRALSYVWGDPSGKLPITIVENQKLFTAYVTKNLVAAITDLQRPENAGAPNIATPPNGDYQSSTPRMNHLFLWVDAVCIDQSNDAERTSQVQIMGEIYARSCGVIVWLPPTRDMAFHPLDLKDYQPIPALRAFFRSPWWSRAWVVQEVTFGPNPEFVYGERHLSWETLRTLLRSIGLREKYYSAYPPHEDLRCLAAEFLHMDERKELYEWRSRMTGVKPFGANIDSLLWHFRARETSLAHDKIYSLLNLADKSIAITPDYTMPVEKVYCELATALATRKPRPSFPLDHIGFTHHGNRSRGLNLPSWVPDWNPFAHDSQLLANYDPEISPYCADDRILEDFPTLLQDLIIPQNVTRLQIQGIDLGHLATVSQDVPNSADLRTSLYIVQKWAALAAKSECSREDFVRILASDRWDDRRTRLPPRLEGMRHEHLKLFNTQPWCLMTYDFRASRQQKGYSSAPPYIDIGEKLTNAVEGWKFGCTTKHGYALVPANAKANDLLCVPVGSSTPFVLRKTIQPFNRGVKQYEFVGRCYVHKFMDGEAMVDIRAALKIAEQNRLHNEEKRKIVLSHLTRFVLV